MVRIVGTIVAGLALALSSCGGEAAQVEPPPTGPLAETLAEIGSGGPSGSLGVSWADRELVRRAGFDRELIARVLAPNADTVVEAAPALRRRFAFNPLAADRYVAVGGSYAFGLRLDGVGAGRLARALINAGGHSRSDGGLELIETGAYAVVPKPLLDADVNGLGAFAAFGEDVAVLAISDRALNALLGEGERLLDEPVYAAAAHCLGDVVAARMVPDKQLLSVEVGIQLVAIGVGRDAEVLCALGGTAERAAQVATNLAGSLDPGARDPVTGERLSASIERVTVSRRSFQGVEVVRAELAPAPGADPGSLLGTIASGSLVSLINGGAEARRP